MAKGFKHGAGGGVALNFKVVTSSTQPENPKQNTIWVQTSRKITGWSFNTEKPNAPEGWVHFQVSNSSPVAFNALKKNQIIVFPITAEMYHDGVWNKKPVMTYQNGAWVNWITYLYNLGDEHTDLTGGFEISFYNDIGQIVVTRDGGRFYLASTGDSNGGCNFYVSTNKKVDLTNFSKLYARIVLTNTHETHFYFSASPVNTQTSSAARAIVSSSGEHLVEVDVSNLSGAYYIMFGLVGGAQNNSGNCYVDEVYLQ